MRGLIAMAAAVLLGILNYANAVAPAGAQQNRDTGACSTAAEIDARIAACGKVLEHGGRGNRAQAYYVRGVAYVGKGEFDPAINDFDEAIRLSPRDGSGWEARAYAYYQKGDYDRAIQDGIMSTAFNTKLANAYYVLGMAYSGKGNYAKAIGEFGEAIRVDPNLAVAYVGRGLAYERKGDADRAKADFQSALTRPANKSDISQTDFGAALEKARNRLAALEPSTPAVAPSPMPSAPDTQIGAGPAAPGTRVALVIGNGNYANVPPLANPTNDAREISGALRELGFKVIEGYNLDSTAMRGRIADFGAALPGAGVTLFYYAGHGVQVAGKNYLIPVDAKLERPSSLGVEAIEVGTVLSDMETEKRVNLVFLDACRDNPLSRSLAKSFGVSRSTAVGQGLAQLNAGVGTLITFATSPDTVALDGSGKNSPFTTAMLKHIRTPGLEIRSMLTRVRSDVIKATNQQQVPWDHSSLTGDFYFRPGS
jgi:tetratricopeptide (TPR) repeat protein